METKLILSGFTSCVELTEALAAEFARDLAKRGERDAFLAMYGDLGAGKTAFVRGLASVLAPGARVCSPTFALVNEYRGKDYTLCHFDMYRITSEDDLYSIGFYDYADCIIVTEWSENIPYALPNHYYRIEITKPEREDTEGDNQKRMIVIEERMS